MAGSAGEVWLPDTVSSRFYRWRRIGIWRRLLFAVSALACLAGTVYLSEWATISEWGHHQGGESREFRHIPN